VKPFADLMLTDPWLSSHCLDAAAAMSSSVAAEAFFIIVSQRHEGEDLPGVGFERSIALIEMRVQLPFGRLYTAERSTI
jgi:hypothetical protein